jgi:hypothetical protein
MASITSLAYFGPHGSFYGQAVRSMILVGKAELWTTVSSPLIHSQFKATRLAQKASRVDSCRGAEI